MCIYFLRLHINNNNKWTYTYSTRTHGIVSVWKEERFQIAQQSVYSKFKTFIDLFERELTEVN